MVDVVKAFRKTYLIPTLTTIFLGGFIIAVSANYTWERSVDQLHKRSAQQLAQFVEHLEGQLARFSFLPELLAKNRLLSDVLVDPNNSALIDLGNRYLEEVNAITGAADTYLMDTNGLTIAASNWVSDKTFIGKNFDFRPYFQEAMLGKSGRYFALGTTSKKRGYYFTYPIKHAADIVGVIVIKMDMSETEAKWADRGVQFLVTDPQGIVFISTHSEWLFKSTKLLTDKDRQAIIESQRYLGAPLDVLGVSEEALSGNATSIHINTGLQGAKTRYLSLVNEMPQAGWSVRILAPTKTARRDVTVTLVVVSLSFLLFVAILMLLWQRNRRRTERERFEIEAKRKLEIKVDERTSDLTREIEERKRTELELLSTRGELVQAAKLAVLGQLSASISHELNNPLAAIRSYADNARKFLIRQENEQVDTNLGRITHLTDRMAKISSELKVFSRKSSGNLSEVSLSETVQAAVDIVRPQCKENGVEICVDIPVEEICIKANAIQLEQVLVNLLSNAIQAVSQETIKQVTLSAESTGDTVNIHVDDSGIGIEESNLQQIFEPFFTTRKTGLGLGLSISYRIIDSMNGRLTAKNVESGGARFSVSLPQIGVDK